MTENTIVPTKAYAMSAPAGPDLAIAPPLPMKRPVPMVPPATDKLEIRDAEMREHTYSNHLQVSRLQPPLQLRCWLHNVLLHVTARAIVAFSQLRSWIRRNFLLRYLWSGFNDIVLAHDGG